MSTASMALLSGAKKKPSAAAAAAAELETPKKTPAPKSPTQAAVKAAAAKAEPEPEATTTGPEASTTENVVEEEVQVDVDSMDEEGIAGLVSEHGIEVPDGWAMMDLAAKKTWLNEQFGEGETATDTAAAAPEPETTKPEAAAPKKEPRKPSAKGKTTKAPTTGKDGEPDLITTVASQLENLKEADARKMVTEIRENSDFGYFKLGGVLAVIQSNGWFEPHASFKDFVEAEHGLKYTRAMYWIRIYNKLVDSGIPWDAVKSLGWTKLKEIVDVITKANVKSWVKTAEKQTVLQLHETVAAHLKAEAQKASGEAGETEPAQTVVTKTFKLHADQKNTVDQALAKAKTAGNTTVDTVALEYVCLDFLGGTQTASTLSGKLQALGIDEALKAFELAFPNWSLTAEQEEAQAAA